MSRRSEHDIVLCRSVRDHSAAPPARQEKAKSRGYFEMLAIGAANSQYPANFTRVASASRAAITRLTLFVRNLLDDLEQARRRRNGRRSRQRAGDVRQRPGNLRQTSPS
jgi:hypothetical protein